MSSVISSVGQLSRIELICGDPERLANFYQDAFGFERTGRLSIDEPAFAELIGIAGARTSGVTLRLVQQTISLVAIEPPGKPYPPDVAGCNLLFQHLAIVVADMRSAFARLAAVAGWTAISTGGPQLLPESSGGVTAFKFRDPEGHPLELLAFPQSAVPIEWQQVLPSVCLGIDHSAISVSNNVASVAFYRELGLSRSGGSLNIGPEQSKLDAVPHAVVDVTSLALPRRSTPHVELLSYQGDFGERRNAQGINDRTATRLVFEVDSADGLAALCARHPTHVLSGPVTFADGSSRAMLRDPDGHLICLEAARRLQPQPPVANPG